MHFDEEKISLPDETITTEPTQAHGFSPEQMVSCGECLRVNPPTRMNCLYCGAALPLTDASAPLRRPTLRSVDEHEQGFNVILMPNAAADVPPAMLTEAITLLRLGAAQLKEMLDAQMALPLARVASREEAALIEKRLAALGLRTEIVSDEVLSVEPQPLKRIRKLELTEDGLTGQVGISSEHHSVAWSEIILLVQGRIFTKRVEIEERPGRSGKKKEVVEERELIADEAALDIYAKQAGSGWRIAANNFDYSCLAERKTLLAKDNFVTLIQMLRSRAASAIFDDDYNQVRHLLTAEWPLAEHIESRGLRRERPGRFNMEVITCVTNEMQFTRYGRLRHYFEMKRSEPSR